MKHFLVLFSVVALMGQAHGAVEKTACFKQALKAYKVRANYNAFEIRKAFELKQGEVLLDFYGNVLMTLDQDAIIYPVHSSEHGGYQIESVVLSKSSCDLITIRTHYSE